MLINGEKYACEACVRGHRVSSCTHSERKLLHVNKKGRPVSQCQHCRSLRKARSQHVKCECHDKAHAKEDCPHLKDGTATAEPNVCCCSHGARCTCSLKKEHHLDTVPEDFPQVIQPKEPHKPRISSLNSHDSKATVFANGHHKPVHKINDAHNHCGAPYRVPSRSHTVHGHREVAQRSTDSLPLLKQATRHNESPLHNSITVPPPETRKAKSEHNSPEFGPINPATGSQINELFIPPLSPNAYSYSPFGSQSPTLPPGGQQEIHLPETIPESWFTTYDEAHALDAMPATGLNDIPAVDWSTFDFSAVNDPYTMSNTGLVSSQTPSYTTSFEHLNFSNSPRLNSSSGDVSDADETGTVGRPSNLRTVSNASNDLSSPASNENSEHRISSASSFMGTPQANMLAGNLNNLDIDEYVKQTMAEQRRINMHLQPAKQTPSPPTPNMQMPMPMPQLSPPQAQIQQQMSPPNSHLQQQPLAQPQMQSPPQMPPTSQPIIANNTNKGYAMTGNDPFGAEHPFTISEAQAYAHMNGNMINSAPTITKGSPMAPNSMSADPMWSGMSDGSLAFKLDDEREDEDWVR